MTDITQNHPNEMTSTTQTRNNSKMILSSSWKKSICDNHDNPEHQENMQWCQQIDCIQAQTKK